MTEEDKYIPVINKDARVMRIAYYADAHLEEYSIEDKKEYARTMGVPLIGKKERAAVKLLPGMNFVLQSELQKSGLLSAGTLDAYQGKIKIVPVDSLDEFEAITIAKYTVSRSSLVAWLGVEERPKVTNAINAQLTRTQGKDAS